MPVMLACEEEYALWLNAEVVEPERLRELFRPFDTERLECYKV